MDEYKEVVQGLIEGYKKESGYSGSQRLALKASKWEQTLSVSDAPDGPFRGLYVTAQVVHPEHVILPTRQALNDFDCLIHLLSEAQIEHPTDCVGQLKLWDPEEDGVVLGHLCIGSRLFDDIWERIRFGNPPESTLSLEVLGLESLGTSKLWDLKKFPLLVVTDASLTFRYESPGHGK
ncbi:hypothetical protein ACFOLJ_05915 [Rugamonas sp. CCM 8940]|uniref:hypothetical protein n=1 Tax=Rugamonas sp. CCM 8940 TaxID=2765359 RepID=UPI0018F4CBC6|nr:hypothetical protein [Rugamonas sp. CCM 8940]MBJ7312742.1 hypothetical protein [Rugamonas sp. CCM 8940]